MAKIERFEDMISWQKAREVTRQVYLLSKKGDFAKDFDLRGQMRSASVSVMSNIAEGFERGGDKEFIQFLSTAKGSCGEVRSQLYVALDQSYISEAEFNNLYCGTVEVGRLVSGFIGYLQKSELRGNKYKRARNCPGHWTLGLGLWTKKMFADLHLHTNFSDGTYSPEELVAQAAKNHLAAIALTDHDTVEGCERAGIACKAAEIEFIPGTELTAEQNENEIHILGYFLDTKNEKLLSEIAKFQAVRQKRIHEMVRLLNVLNVPLKVEDVIALANCRSPGRPHVARALVKAGFCGTMDEAFERFLKKHRPAWVPKAKISSQVAIELIHQANGLAVMAHPGLNRTDEVIPDLVEAGLDGIECFHTKHSTAVSEHYLEIADEYNLLVTGGSDCHGMSKGKPLIGTVKLPYQQVEKLKEAVAARSQVNRG